MVESSDVNSAYKLYHDKWGGKKDKYFGLVYISKKFNIPLEQALDYISFQDTTYSFDGYFHDARAKNFYIFVFRWSDDHLSLKNPLNQFTKVGVESIFNPDEITNNQSIIKLKTSLAENQNLINRILFQFIFNGDPAKAEQSKLLDLLKENIESKKYVIDRYFGRQVDMITQFLSNQRLLGYPFLRKESAQYDVKFDDFLNTTDNDNQLFVMFLSLKELYRMYSNLGEKFFEKNIRSGLDEGKMTNKEIKKSLRRIIEREEAPERFSFYHNGVALTAQEIESNSNTIRLIEPRLLNGAQTVKTLKQFVDESRNSNNVIQEKLDKIKVIARIVKSVDDEFLKSVTINNNRQNPIMPWNLRANDLVQLHFEEIFRNKLGIFYERRENAFENLAEQELEEMNITHKKAIEIRKFAQTLLALQGEVDKISDIREIFENEHWYKETFKERYLDVDPRKFVFLYKVNFRLPSIIREIQNIGSEKYDYVGRARNLLWCLSLQGLLNDSKFESYVDKFGSSLIVEADFTNVLKEMASGKLRFILRDTFDTEKYSGYLAQMKFSFLRSKSTFSSCMETARKLYGWKKETI